MVLVFNRNDLLKALSMKDAIQAVEEAFRFFTKGQAIMPSRLTITLENYNGINFYMPAYIGGMDALAMKVVSVYLDNNKKYNLPTTLGTILLNDSKTGALLAIMDGAYLTAMRTGAVSGVASKYLSRCDSGKVGIFGAGIQAKAQLRAIHEVRKIEKAYVYDINLEAAKKYAHEMTQYLGITILAVDEPIKAVKNSDIICTATSSTTPVFNGSWVKKGTHINGIGSHTPQIRELDTTLVKRGKLVVDSYEACLKEAGDIIIPLKEGAISKNHIYAELGELVTTLKSGRTSNDEITVFKSVGLAIQDAAIALKAYDCAFKKDIGRKIAL